MGGSTEPGSSGLAVESRPRRRSAVRVITMAMTDTAVNRENRRIVLSPRGPHSRAWLLVGPDYRLCSLCGLVWNIGQDFCPAALRSIAEDRMLGELWRKTA